MAQVCASPRGRGAFALGLVAALLLAIDPAAAAPRPRTRAPRPKPAKPLQGASVTPSEGGGEGEATRELNLPGELALVGARAPEWRWRQLLSSPRIGGRLTTIIVDPKDPLRIFVGTEEGTLVRSTDGGETWDERNLTPFVVAARSIGAGLIGAPDPQDATSERLAASSDPPNRFYGDDLPIPYITSIFFGEGSALPSMGFPPYIVGAPPEASLLFEVVASRSAETIPVRRIALCPGGQFPLLVATTDAVYGSADDGQSVLRLFFTAGGASIEQVACSPEDPEDVYVATEDGLFRSTNGGLSFDTVLTADPGQPSTAVAFGREPTHNVEIVYDASAGSIYGGDPDSIFGLQYLYPPDDDAETAPWADIRGITVSPGGDIWLATEEGVRVSRDGAHTFLNVEPRLFGGQRVLQVVIDAEDRVAVMLRDQVYVSEDEGATWHVFFSALTRRSFRRMATARDETGESRWWIVTSGEVWTNTLAPEGPAGRVDRAAQAWARRELHQTPPLSAAIDGVLETTELSPGAIEAVADRSAARALIPLIDLRITYTRDAYAGELAQAPSPRMVRSDLEDRDLEVLVLATWPMFESKILAEESDPVRSALYELRRQIQFAAEDAWHERVSILQRISRGLGDATELATLRARVDALEAVLDVWGWKRGREASNDRSRR